MRKSIVVIVVLCVAGGCARDQVVWNETSYRGPPRETVMPAGRVMPATGGCPGPVSAARAGPATFAAWWKVRADSSAELVVGRSHDGGVSWESVVTADSTDHSVRGCARPQPAVAADSARGYVSIVYFIEPTAGRAIFFCHSMDGGRTFHSPVPVVFGDNTASVSIAMSGDRVAVAYEDPNSTEPVVGVALSRTMGHIFEHREAISSDNERAGQPAVALRHDTVRVWWSDRSADPRVSATRTAYREGVWN